jgi:hypothetical protein
MLFLLANILYAQKHQIGLQASYPITVGNTFFSDYKGIIDFGLDYKYLLNEKLAVKISFDNSRFKIDIFSTTTKVSVNKFRIGIDYQIWNNNYFILLPEFRIGYARFTFENDRVQFAENQNAFNTLVGLQLLYPFNKVLSFGILCRYDFSCLEKHDTAMDSPYNRRVHTYNIGIQINFRL